ncbi:MAG: hypothetical protein LBG27_02345 [Spirochaetaceae bacterium]|jgi:hypothetical protein|nr:hypothetical protein [Spirochaetaceae bacterium]
MKKLLVLSAVLFTAVTIETYAIGLGVQFGGNMLSGFDEPGFSILISPNEQVHGAVTWYIGSGGLSLGGSADYWFLPIKITTLGPGDLKFFVGGGVYARIAIWEDYFGLGAGLRLPIGVDWKANVFDVFVQAVPQVGIGLLPSPGFDGFYVDLNLGARFWLG